MMIDNEITEDYVITSMRGVFRALSNIYDEAFCENS